MKTNRQQYKAPVVKTQVLTAEPLLDLSVKADNDPIIIDPTPGTGDDQAANDALFEVEDTKSVWE